ncbi:erythromycin esterase family protein [Paludibaculum fermentans]|uniref:Erythromycin esterase family protein n=1 Tax=Paludibaculum fermentans TaxID=1473598 RepID=A0A7S7NWW1_PALFE|nr:erythromycin esterase family protein [Paludibaculum fermentans]QOY91245.1 erythromycin esterase family protein [Paludibaculum fermentans]
MIQKVQSCLFTVALLLAAPAHADDAPNRLTCLSAASFQPTAAPDSRVSAFGTNLAASTESATHAQLAESLAGTSVTVEDAAGDVRMAGILFASPSQVDFVLPSETSIGIATIVLRNAAGDSLQGSLLVQKVAPGLFSANQNGRGPAMADATGSVGGVQTSLPVVQFDETYRRYRTVPLDLTASDGGITVSLYGTGARAAETLTAKLGVQDVEVIAFAPYDGHPGMDKVDILIPPSLANRGTASLQLTADGVPSNSVTLSALHYQYANLGFENVTFNGTPWYWNYAGTGYSLAFDSSVHRSGKKSLRIKNTFANEPAMGFAYEVLPLDNTIVAARGKNLRVSAWIKTSKMTRGSAGLMLLIDGPSERLSTDTAACASGTSDWQFCTIERIVDPEAAFWYLVLTQTGDGTAWFDDLEFSVDDVVYPDNPPLSGEPTTNQLEWVQSTASPFLTADAGNGFDDLAWVKGLVGDAKIVGLGESTHGTSEFFRMKHRLFEYLATNMGFTVLAVEAGMPEAYRLNDYLLNGVGDPVSLIRGMQVWRWNTEEILDMVRWMREFNESGKGRLQFAGFDMQLVSGAIRNVLPFLERADPAFYSTAISAYAEAQVLNDAFYREVISSTRGIPVAAAVISVRQHLQEHRSDYLMNFDARTVDWALQNAIIVEQATQIAYGGISREQAMAANIEWILQQNPGAKMVVWAHNNHIARSSYGPRLGAYLDRAHGVDYLPIAQLLHSGYYNAKAEGDPGAYYAQLSTPGTLEYVLHSTGMPMLALDLRKVATDDPASSWLLRDMEIRSTGLYPSQLWTQTGTLTCDFDAVIFFEHTTPSKLLP